jgi:FKBP-type peptidyl-prolyl cis-trans isomerase
VSVAATGRCVMVRSWRSRPVCVLVALVLATAACGENATGPQTPEDVTFSASLGVDLAVMTRLPLGVFIQTLTEGSGTPMIATDRFAADVQGWTSDGNQFQPLLRLSDVTLDGLISGFAGMVGMTVGETRLLAIPSQLGYGSSGAGSIPGDAVLVFKVTLLTIGS